MRIEIEIEIEIETEIEIGVETRKEGGEERRGGEGVDVRKKNKNPTLRMWGKKE